MLKRRGAGTTIHLFGWLALAGLLACGNEAADQSASDPHARSPQQQAALEPVRSASNRSPTIHGIAIVPEWPRAGDTVKLDTNASDPDGDVVNLEVDWTLDGETQASGDRKLAIPAGSKGKLLVVDVVARDGHGGIARERASVTIDNTAPTVTAVQFDPPSGLTVEDELVATISGQDLDDDDLFYRYRWLVNDHEVAADGAALDQRHFRRGDRIVLEVRASDGETESAPIRSAAVEVVNAPPRIHSSPDEIHGEQNLHYRMRAKDPDGDRQLRFRLVQAPEGLTLDWMSGELAWTPGEDQAGTHLVEIEVADSEGGSTTQKIELRVGPDSGPASIR
ncbi:MAG: hypothetical protein JRG90_18190 [Deltaproteobacteria bacterium]|nr:hypothetical protein [Deltaproteobacteria bacterium]